MLTGRLPLPLLFSLASTALAGCTTTSSNPTAMIPADLQATVMAEDQGRTPGGPVSVDDMLARARGEPPGSAQGGAQTAAQAGAPGARASEGGAVAYQSVAGRPPGAPPAGAAADGFVTGSVPQVGMAGPAAAVTAQPVGARSVATLAGPGTLTGQGTLAVPGMTGGASAGAQMGGDTLYEVVYDGTEAEPSTIQAAGLAKKLKAAKLPAKTEVTILVGPGPGATAFDQALLANRRARAVKSLLPADWVARQTYDPTAPPDTVSVVVGARN